MPHELIALSQWPSLPAPFASSDAGEAWVWGDYVALLQKAPPTMAEKLGGRGYGPVSLKYLFVMTVFYRKDRNPHGPSSRPIWVATLEQLDQRLAARQMGISRREMGSMGLTGEAPIVRGLFSAGVRLNLGNFEEVLTRDSARAYFLDLMREQFSLEGEPLAVGTIQEIYGHPETGFPESMKTDAARELGERRRKAFRKKVISLLYTAFLILIFWYVFIRS